MRLTIICEDGYVSIDKAGYSGLIWLGTPEDIHALQWFEDNGWIEYENSTRPNLTITALPAWAVNAIEAWQIRHDEPQPILPTVEQNTETANVLLQQTNWIFDPQVVNPPPDAYTLGNRQDFLTFRSEVEFILTGIHAGPIQFPTMPEPVWNPPQQ
jgi:hypothetical protein